VTLANLEVCTWNHEDKGNNTADRSRGLGTHQTHNQTWVIGLATICIMEMAVHNTVVDGCGHPIHHPYAYISSCLMVQYGCTDGHLMVITTVQQKEMVRLA
jgi:hypothetical protein